MNIYALGYDKKKNYHKILNYVSGFEIYDFGSNSWKLLLDVTPNCDIWFHQGGVTVKGNAYFVAQREIRKIVKITHVFLLCFDFTRKNQMRF